MKRNGTIVNYNGYELVKKGATFWSINSNGKMVGYAETLAKAKGAVDRRNERE